MTDQAIGFPLEAGRHYETREGGKTLIRLAGAEAGTSGYVFAGDNGMLYLPTGRVARDDESPRDLVALASVVETEDGQAIHNYYPTPNGAGSQNDRIQANLQAEAQALKPIAKTPADEAVLSQGGEAVIQDDATAGINRTVTVDTTINTDREEAPLQGIKTPDTDALGEQIAAQHQSELMHPADGEQNFSSPEIFGENETASAAPASEPAPLHQNTGLTDFGGTQAEEENAATESDAPVLGSGLDHTPPTADGGGVSTTPPPTSGGGHQSNTPTSTTLVTNGGTIDQEVSRDASEPLNVAPADGSNVKPAVESDDARIEAQNKRLIAEGGTPSTFGTNSLHTSDDVE